MIELVQGDITTAKADVIVNAANPRLEGCFLPDCACVDKAVHAAAGEKLKEACEKQLQAIRAKIGETYEQPVGIPMMTDAFDLPAKKIVHVVGPAVNGALTDVHREQLVLCYKNTLMLCERRGMKSVAFCCLSTGYGAFPREEAAEIAVRTVKSYLEEHTGIERVIFHVLQDEDFRLYQALL